MKKLCTILAAAAVAGAAVLPLQTAHAQGGPWGSNMFGMDMGQSTGYPGYYGAPGGYPGGGGGPWGGNMFGMDYGQSYGRPGGAWGGYPQQYPAYPPGPNPAGPARR